MSFLLAVALVAALHSPRASVREEALQPLLRREAKAAHISPRLLASLVYHESTFRVGAIGDHGRSFGLMQTRRNCLPWRRFTRAELLLPDINVHTGVARLTWAIKLCGGNISNALSHYNGRGCRRSVYSVAVLTRN